MPTEAYRLPNLLALLPERPSGEINPHFKEFEAAFNAWAEKTFDGPLAVNVSRCENALFIATLYPLASQHQLMGVGYYVATALLVDDLVERSSIEDASALAQLWMKVLRDGNEGKNVQQPLIEVLRSELMVSIRPAVGSFHWPEFVAENEMAVKDMVQEAHDREAYQNKNAVLDIQSYMIKRQSTVGARIAFVLLRSTHGLYISGNVMANPVVQEMENAATEMLFIANDIYSFKKEYGADGAFTNILTVIRNDPETAHLDFQGRLDYSEKLFKVAVDRFQACRQELPSFGPEMDQYLTLYADGLLDLAIGNVQWSRVASRYKTFTNDEDRRNNIMRLALDG